MARVDGVSFVTSDGVSLGGTWHRSPRPAERVVLVAGATAVPHRFYARWAADLADRGFDVFTFDYRGVGASRPPSLAGFAASMQDWGRRDLGAAFALAEAAAQGRPVSFVGHSFGGQALGLLEGGERLAGGFTVAAGWGWPGYQPAWRRPGLWAVWYAAVPFWLSTLGYVPARAGLGDGLPGGVAAEWSTWCRSRDYLLDHVPDARARFAAVQAPFRVWSVSDDGYIPPPAVAELAKVLPAATHVELDGAAFPGGLGHFGFFRSAARALWDEAAQVLAAPGLQPPVTYRNPIHISSSVDSPHRTSVSTEVVSKVQRSSTSSPAGAVYGSSNM
jgi:predicted alpha/beta hydrolase